jgi:hypothetical protein
LQLFVQDWHLEEIPTNPDGQVTTQVVPERKVLLVHESQEMAEEHVEQLLVHGTQVKKTLLG